MRSRDPADEHHLVPRNINVQRPTSFSANSQRL